MSKGVSEVVGYIFILGIVLTVITFTLIQVSGIIRDVSDRYKIEGFRESFKRIQNVFFLSAYGGAPMQTIQIELQGGTIYISKDLQIEITAGNQSIYLDASSIIFEYRDYMIAIENGAVYERYYVERSIVDPRIFIQLVEVQGVPGSYQKVLTAILYRIDGNLSMSGFGTVKLMFSSKFNRSILDEEGVMTLKIERSKFPEVWYNYFKSLNETAEISEFGEHVKVSISYNKLVLAILDVEVRAESVI